MDGAKTVPPVHGQSSAAPVAQIGASLPRRTSMVETKSNAAFRRVAAKAMEMKTARFSALPLNTRAAGHAGTHSDAPPSGRRCDSSAPVLGVGLRAVHFQHMLHHRPEVDWFEEIGIIYVSPLTDFRRVVPRLQAGCPKHPSIPGAITRVAARTAVLGGTACNLHNLVESFATERGRI